MDSCPYIDHCTLKPYIVDSLSKTMCEDISEYGKPMLPCSNIINSNGMCPAFILKIADIVEINAPQT